MFLLGQLVFVAVQLQDARLMSWGIRLQEFTYFRLMFCLVCCDLTACGMRL